MIVDKKDLGIALKFQIAPVYDIDAYFQELIVDLERNDLVITGHESARQFIGVVRKRTAGEDVSLFQRNMVEAWLNNAPEVEWNAVSPVQPFPI